MVCGPLPGVVGQSQADTANGPSKSSPGAWSTVAYEPSGYDCSMPSYRPSTEVVTGRTFRPGPSGFGSPWKSRTIDASKLGWTVLTMNWIRSPGATLHTSL